MRGVSGGPLKVFEPSGPIKEEEERIHGEQPPAGDLEEDPHAEEEKDGEKKEASKKELTEEPEETKSRPPQSADDDLEGLDDMDDFFGEGAATAEDEDEAPTISLAGGEEDEGAHSGRSPCPSIRVFPIYKCLFILLLTGEERGRGELREEGRREEGREEGRAAGGESDPEFLSDFRFRYRYRFQFRLS